MGIFFNPGNGSFTKDRNYEIYVDKTELLKYLNRAIGTPKNCIAVSHARRFGKSHAAGMIDAYYTLGSDSAKLFKGTKIASFIFLIGMIPVMYPSAKKDFDSSDLNKEWRNCNY